MASTKRPDPVDSGEPSDPREAADAAAFADPAAAEPRRERQQDARRHRAEIAQESDHGRHDEDRSRPPSVVRKSR